MLLSQHPFNSMALVHSGTHPTSPDASCWRIKWLQSSETHLSVQEVRAVVLPPSPPLGYFILLGFVLLLQGWCAYTQLDCLFLWLLQSVAVCTIKNRIFHNHSPRNLCTQYSPLPLPNFTVKMLLQIHATKLWRCSFVPAWVTNFGHSFRIYRNLAIVKSSLITI